MPDSRRPETPSPWSFTFRLRMFCWDLCWVFFCLWTPKPFNGWRLLWLRLFGARISGRPFVHQRARIAIPWHLELHDRACVGDRANLYSLGQITLEEGCIIAQEAYLCTGDHDLTAAQKPLITAPIIIQSHAFIGARAMILKGVTVGQRAVVGACSVVTRNVPAATTVTGNPARKIESAPAYSQ